jgi:glycosyltransferase involved in cell wall biosynthesis
MRCALDCEVFVVDSGSTDRTLEIAESFGVRPPARCCSRMRRGGHEFPVLTTEMDRSAAVLPCCRCGSRRDRWSPPARHRASRDERPGRRSNLISRRDDRRLAAISPAGTLLQRCYRVDGWLCQDAVVRSGLMFAARRVEWIFDRELTPIGVQVIVHALPPPQYTTADWRRHRSGVIDFNNVVLKYLYYRAKD